MKDSPLSVGCETCGEVGYHGRFGLYFGGHEELQRAVPEILSGLSRVEMPAHGEWEVTLPERRAIVRAAVAPYGNGSEMASIGIAAERPEVATELAGYIDNEMERREYRSAFRWPINDAAIHLLRAVLGVAGRAHGLAHPIALPE